MTLFATGVPRVIDYQGRLTSDSGQPVLDGDYFIRFSIYDGPDGPATQLWTSNNQQVTVTNGLVKYELGSLSPLPEDIFDDTVRYIGIKVGTDPELTPRERFLTVPYAYRAMRADSVTEPIYVHRNGDSLSGPLYFTQGGEASYRTRLQSTPTGGQLTLTNGTLSNFINLQAGISGNASVQLPEGAITIGEFDAKQVPATDVFTIYPSHYYSTSLTYDVIDSFQVSVPNAGRVKVSVTGTCYLDWDNPRVELTYFPASTAKLHSYLGTAPAEQRVMEQR